MTAKRSFMKTEIWKETIYPKYDISNFGRIRSRKNNLPKILSTTKRVYEQITISSGKSKPQLLIHRLVALAFIPNTHNKSEVNHKDGNKLNNHVLNLEWVTKVETQCHSKINRRFSSLRTGVGFYPKTGKWRSRYKNIHLGYFESEMEAYSARKLYEISIGESNKYL